jgi:uncharacterized repeat protein (TIGR03847 family)
VSELWEFGDVDTFTAGALGRPGQRVFFVQIRAEGRRLTLKCEKQQVAALADYLSKLLADLPPPDDLPMRESLELVPPTDPLFVVGPMGLAFDAETDRFVVMLEEAIFEAPEDEAPEDGTNEPESTDPFEASDAGRVRLHLTRSQAVAFAGLAQQLVSAGRPPCLFCGQPIDPDGHPCPRMN